MGDIKVHETIFLRHILIKVHFENVKCEPEQQNHTPDFNILLQDL